MTYNLGYTCMYDTKAFELRSFNLKTIFLMKLPQQPNWYLLLIVPDYEGEKIQTPHGPNGNKTEK
jgi:hypothetical protein